jgi:hypothetical protein
MKSKKILIIAALLMVFGLSTHALAAPAFHICTVEQVGVGSLDGAPVSFISLKEQNDAWGPVWFVLNPAVAKELLAVGMTAQISDKMVQAMVDPAVPFTTVDFMYLLK